MKEKVKEKKTLAFFVLINKAITRWTGVTKIQGSQKKKKE